MPIRGYIIEKYNTMTNAYTCNRLVQEASALDMNLQIVGIHDTAVSPHGVINHGKILEPVDFVINRYKWGREKDAINALATRSYNPLTAYNIYTKASFQSLFDPEISSGNFTVAFFFYCRTTGPSLCR